MSGYKSRFPGPNFTPKVFTPSTDGYKTLAVNSTSAAVALGSGSSAQIVNTGNDVAYVLFGGNTAQSNTGCIAVLANTVALYGIPDTTNFNGQRATHLAAVSVSNTTLQITTGWGI